MSDTSKPQTSGVLFALAAFAIFATHDVVVKYLGASYSPVQVVFFSVLFGFPFVTLFMMREVRDSNLRPRHPWWTVLRTFSVVVTGLTAFYAFATLPLAQTYAILFAAPLLITLLAIPILGERVGWRRGLAVVVGLAGVLVVLRPGAEPLGLGHAAALVAAVGGAMGAIIMRKIGAEERSVVLLLYPLMGNFLVMGGALGFVYEPMPAADLGASAVVAAFALIATGCLIVAYRLAPAAIVAPMQYSQIIWASIYGYFLFDESPDRYTVIGSAIIIASGLFIVLREARGPNSANMPVISTKSRPGLPAVPRISALLRQGSGKSRPPTDH